MRSVLCFLVLLGLLGSQRASAQGAPVSTPVIEDVKKLPVDRLIALIQDSKDPSWGPARLELMARGSSPEAIAKLLPLCTKPLGSPSQTAIQILLSYKAKELTPIFIKWCANRAFVMTTTLDYMDQLGDNDPAQKAALIELYRSNNNREYKGQILALLGKMNAVEMIPEMKAFVEQPGGRNEYAALGLAEMGDKSGVDKARKILEDNITSKMGNYYTVAALQALGANGDAADLGLIDRLQKRFPHPYNNGLPSLTIERFKIQHHGQAPADQVKDLCGLLTLPLTSTNMQVSMWAIHRLAEINTPASQAKLIEIATSHEYPIYRSESDSSLQRFGLILPHHFEGVNCVYEAPPIPKP